MMYAALPTAGRFLVRRKRPNRPAVDNALRASWRPLKGGQFKEAVPAEVEGAETLPANCQAAVMIFEEVAIGGCQSYLLGSTAAVRVSWADEGSPTQSLAIEGTHARRVEAQRGRSFLSEVQTAYNANSL